MCPIRTIFKFRPSDWKQGELFTAWFDHFIKKLHPSESNHILLILDTSALVVNLEDITPISTLKKKSQLEVENLEKPR